ncbi:MAG: elongation factor Ts [Bacteriovoracaceae bacterium]|nr:elongation factor Ts [Bacteriovoracaceae bacterium]
MAITAKDVKELREKSGAGMMDCKKALTECDGDMEKSIDFLRTKGLAAAQKKQSRIAAEGVIAIELANGSAAMVEVNCETDFVGKNDAFVGFAGDVAKYAIETEGTFNADEGKLKEDVTQLTLKLGEKISFRRSKFVKLGGKGIIGSYVHGGKIGVLVELSSDADLSGNSDAQELAKNVAMHVAAAAPKFLKGEDMDQDFIKREEEIYKVQLIEQGKPEAMIAKILQGKISKLASEVCLLEQKFVMEPDSAVKKYIADAAKKIGSSVDVKSFEMFRLGEGIEKKEDNLADEVAKLTAK